MAQNDIPMMPELHVYPEVSSIVFHDTCAQENTDCNLSAHSNIAAPRARFQDGGTLLFNDLP